jgi:hypothetical protein
VLQKQGKEIDNMAKRSSGLSVRYKKSYDTKDSGGMGVPAFDWKMAGKDLKFFKPIEGTNRINIVPYRIKTKKHPLVKSGDLKIGDIDYNMDLWIHRSIGVVSADVICPKKNFGKPCPICEQAEQYRSAGKQKEYEAFQAKRRVFYNVIDVKNPEKGMMVLDTSHFLFEKELIEEARQGADDGQIVDFADISDGKTIKFRASEATYNKQKFFEFKSFQFIDREDALDEDLIEQAVSFDELMKTPTYEEIEKIMYGEEDEEEEEATLKKVKNKKETEEEEEEEEATLKKVKNKKETEEGLSKKVKNTIGKCKHGHIFGNECDNFDDCNTCADWDACVKAQ